MSSDYVFDDLTIENKISEYYNNYLDLFQNHTNFINDKEIYRLRFPDVDYYDYTFFHIITKNISKSECICPRKGIECKHPFKYNPWMHLPTPRELCPHRMIATICLANFFNKELKIWETVESKKGQRTRINCFCEQDDYIVVLELKKDGRYFIVTSYPVEFKHRRDHFIKQYNDYINNKEHIIYKTSTK